MDEIATLRAVEAAQERRMAYLDVLSQKLAGRSYTTMVTPQMPEGTWAEGKRISDDRVGFVSAPKRGLPPRGYRPAVGHVLIVAIDVAERLAA